MTLREENILDKKSRRRFFDRISSNYDRHYSKSIPFGTEIANDVSGMLKQATHILDVGCSTGFHTSLLTKATFVDHVVGIDFSNGMVTIAHKNFGTNDSVSLVTADIEYLPFKDNSFDGISCAFVISILETFEWALKEMHRVLTKGGKIVIVDVEPYDKRPKATNHFFPWHPGLRDIGKPVGSYRVEESLRRSGLTVTNAKKYRLFSEGSLVNYAHPNSAERAIERCRELNPCEKFYAVEASKT